MFVGNFGMCKCLALKKEAEGHWGPIKSLLGTARGMSGQERPPASPAPCTAAPCTAAPSLLAAPQILHQSSPH
eukprot:1152982-Pelagomonas_calceolata.AAC.3